MILNGFQKKSFFRIVTYVELETPPFMEKNILNFHFDYLIISLTETKQDSPLPSDIPGKIFGYDFWPMIMSATFFEIPCTLLAKYAR